MPTVVQDFMEPNAKTIVIGTDPVKADHYFVRTEPLREPKAET